MSRSTYRLPIPIVLRFRFEHLRVSVVPPFLTVIDELRKLYLFRTYTVLEFIHGACGQRWLCVGRGLNRMGRG